MADAVIFPLFLASFFLIYIYWVGMFRRQTEGYVYMVSEQVLWGWLTMGVIFIIWFVNNLAHRTGLALCLF